VAPWARRMEHGSGNASRADAPSGTSSMLPERKGGATRE
jgi:hypothetical protein